MADSKLADLTATTSPASTDILYIVVDPAGTPADRKVTVANLVKDLATKADPLGLGFPVTIDPRLAASSGNVSGVANRCNYYRTHGGGTITSIALYVVASSGNIGLAAYDVSGSGRSAVPSTRAGTSGAVACPAIGYASVALGASTTLQNGGFLAVSADNTTASFAALDTWGSDFMDGLAYQEASAHPPPASAGTLTNPGRVHSLIGIA